MITSLRVQSFKSWSDTRKLQLGKLTGFFGANSSGKTGILQLLLLLKQTAESPDRSLALDLGQSWVAVDVGGWSDIVHRHEVDKELMVSLSWDLPRSLEIQDPEDPHKNLLSSGALAFSTTIGSTNGGKLHVKELSYFFADHTFVFARTDRGGYELRAEGPRGFEFRKAVGRPREALPPPVKCYGFPDQVRASYQNAGFLFDFALAFEKLLGGVYYLGPLRAYPERRYAWRKDMPWDVGPQGKLAVAALLASREQGKKACWGRKTLEGHIASWLRKLSLVESFDIREVREGSSLYEVVVQVAKGGPKVALTDVGFGVSQILPVLVLCFYAPEGSTIILEQPEIHLHPSVQMGLADVLIEAVEKRKVQIIVESHSEYLLRRLQRRIAEDKIKAEESRLYFCRSEGGQSIAEPLNLDLYGYITNWPEGFFGDEMTEVVEMTKAAQQRRARGQE
ncbi:MAG TPA: DUF3696 domain-containing protein [Thermoanaerobaculaceae bacterium]|nr:DUF3696 domain-containing protein [Thermoanaerobaculaceae bacterium]